MRRFVTSLARTLALALAVALGLGCASKAPAPKPPPVPLHLEPACDLAPGAGLSWIVELRPRAIAQIPDLIPAIALVVPEPRLDTFMKAHGGVDLRQVKELCVASYARASLAIALVPLRPDALEAAFEASATSTVRRTILAQRPPVVRLTATTAGEPRQLVVFGREAAVLERGEPGPLRAAEAFAFGRLKRASPALTSAALRRASEVLGATPEVRAFAPGPFEGEAAGGLGGLLRAATAVGVSARWTGEGPKVAVRVVVTGAWGDDAPRAAERLAAAVHVLSESAAGRLFGLDHPARAPSVHVEPEALVLDAVLDADLLARGIHDAVDADVAEIMRR
jgi:hypothetical protein